MRDTSQDVTAYYFYSVVDLFLMPKQRVNRTIRSQRKSTGTDEAEELKGKWLIDLRNGHASPDLRGAFVHIKHYLDEREAIFHEILACHGDFVGEEMAAAEHPAGRKIGRWMSRQRRHHRHGKHCRWM